ncbi:MAG: hypothetical protein V5A59_08035, partial [Bacteroidales bacterium]
RCDGRTSTTSDRPSHCGSFPISYPVIHEKEDRYYWNGLYGINDMDVEELVELGRSWAYAPDIEVRGNNFLSEGYDKSERCYRIKNTSGQPEKIQLTLNASKDNPVVNPAFYLENWSVEDAKVLMNGKEINDYRIGIKHELEGDDLILFLFHKSFEPTTITIKAY